MTDQQRTENQSEKMIRQVSQFCRNFIVASQNGTRPHVLVCIPDYIRACVGALGDLLSDLDQGISELDSLRCQMILLDLGQVSMGASQ